MARPIFLSLVTAFKQIGTVCVEFQSGSDAFLFYYFPNESGAASREERKQHIAHLDVPLGFTRLHSLEECSRFLLAGV